MSALEYKPNLREVQTRLRSLYAREAGDRIFATMAYSMVSFTRTSSGSRRDCGVFARSGRALEGPIIQSVRVVDQLTRGETLPFRSSSGPGHTLHVVTSGRVEQRVNGVRQVFGTGTTVWYYEDEEVQGRILEAPWTFITISFAAPTIMPPPSQQRVRPASQELIRRAETLLRTWRDVAASPLARHIRVHALLLEIIADCHRRRFGDRDVCV